MFPALLIGTVAVATIGYILNDKEEKSKKKKKKKLQKQKQRYQQNLQVQSAYIQREKQSKIFKMIKNEQSALKMERKQLYSLRDNLYRNTHEYKQVNTQIQNLSSQINRKQQDADRVRL
ncbi:MAG: hypothetical protein DRG27_05635 [Deltaproteobacteria bacterium]|nr:MAG: hypothetical protein DRG27_05635 [Deltaproteobacteria bacterium]